MAQPTLQGDRPPPYNYGATATNPKYPVPPPPAYQDPSMTGYYPAPPPMPPPSQQTTTIITQPQTVLIRNACFGEAPVSMVCPYCHTHVVTSTRYEDGLLTWLAAGGICLIGCSLGCCLIPFCIDGCKDVIHSCPNCQARLGTYRRL